MSEQILFDEIANAEQRSERHHQSKQEHRSTQSGAMRRLGYFLAITLIALPIPFGAVHERVFLTYDVVLSIITLSVLIKRREFFYQLIAGGLGRLAQIISVSLIVTIVFAFIQYVFLGWTNESHPILGSANLRPDVSQFINSWRDLCCFLALFILTVAYLNGSERRQTFLARGVMFSGFLVSLIALSHWFYDTGKLFWLFEPDTVFASNRARWPFVNANHLGDFLLPIVFLILGGVINLFLKIFAHEVARGRRRNRTLIALIGSEDFHLKVLKPCLLCVPLLSVTLAILGSQSRGAWFGGSVGLIVFFLLTSSKPKAEPPLDQSNVIALQQKSQRVNKRRGRSEQAMRMDGSWAVLIVKNAGRFIKPAVVLASALILVFFLNSHGRELVAGRIEYGLLYSLDDIRWTFYKNSWPMLLEHPLFGVGLGAWFTFFPRYAAPELAGLNAVYLHSDPYQFLIEMGLVGAFPMILICIAVCIFGFRSLPSSYRHEQKILNAALFCGLLSFSLASLPEFPLRIPAIQALIAVILGFFVCSFKSQNKSSL